MDGMRLVVNWAKDLDPFVSGGNSSEGTQLQSSQ